MNYDKNEIPPDGEDIVIGIELGTTNSCAAVFMNNDLLALNNWEDKSATPSVVFWSKDTCSVGNQARKKLFTFPRQTFWGTKRFIGRNFNDPVIQEDKKCMGYTIVAKPDGKIGFDVPGVEKPLGPECIATAILAEIKSYSLLRLKGKRITRAVITVPAYFTEAQKAAIRAAGSMAGLDVLYLLSAPTAAALAYGYQFRLARNKTIMVIDLGGGTYDISVIDAENMVFNVAGRAGDSHFGGQDVDVILARYCMEQFEKMTGKKFESQGPFYAKLIRKCEKAKISLTDLRFVSIDVNFGEEEVTINVSRMLFDSLLADFLDNLKGTIDLALESAQTNIEGIDLVLLVGGATRIPAVLAHIESLVGQSKISEELSKVESVAKGAALLAAKLSGVQSPSLDGFILQDRTTFPIGVKTICKITKKMKFSILINENTCIPAKSLDGYLFTNSVDDVPESIVPVIEGPYTGPEDIEKNVVMGEIVVHYKEKLKRGEQRVEVKIEIDVDGQLKAIVRDLRRNFHDILDSKIRKWEMDPFERLLTTEQILIWKRNNELEEKRRIEIGSFQAKCLALMREIRKRLAVEGSNEGLTNLLDSLNSLQHTFSDQSNVEEFKVKLSGICNEFEGKKEGGKHPMPSSSKRSMDDRLKEMPTTKRTLTGYLGESEPKSSSSDDDSQSSSASSNDDDENEDDDNIGCP